MLDATSFRRIITIRICYSVCLDVIVFLETSIDHIYCFEKIVCDEVEYLRHVVTPQGLKSNNQNLHCQVFPFSLKHLQQFLGLTSLLLLFYTRDCISTTLIYQERGSIWMVSRYSF